MRSITSHNVDSEDNIGIVVCDQPGHGGACHRYHVSATNSGRMAPLNIAFQNGPIKENNVNGITQEILLAIVKDRLECFQLGAFACESNEEALYHVNKALLVLQQRTRERIARNVEGLSVI